MVTKIESEEVDFKESQTFENLRQSFFSEAGLMLRYEYFAKIADFEGLDKAKNIFTKFAEGGTCNVHGSLDFLRDAGDPEMDIVISDSFKNLETSLLSETKGCVETYPEMAARARAEGLTDIASWFDTLAKLKASHAEQMKKLLLTLSVEDS